MSLKDALGFEAFNLKDTWRGIRHDPKRLLLGVDPLSTKAWNTVLGRNDKPIVNQLGGPTKDRYKRAQDEGIKTGTASTLHGIASVIAGGYGAYGAAGGLGNAAGGVGAGVGGGATGGTVAGGGATGAGIAGGAAEAIPEVVITGSSGSGLGTAAAGAGVGAGGATAANSNSGHSWRDQLQMPGQDQNSGDDYAAEQRRQMELMMEQERLRRESFRRNQIARALA
jgi:hypothetical protein